MSLNQLEHTWIRPKFKEPRIHFALVCAAVGCPPLRPEAYTGDRLEAQLAEQTAYVHRHPRWFQYDAASNTLGLTSLYAWYGDDFVQAAGSVKAYVAGLVPAVAVGLERTDPPLALRFLDYSWKLNDVRNRPAG